MDDDIIEQIEKKFNEDEPAIKWTQFIIVRKQNERVEDPIPPIVFGWLEKAIGILANQMVKHEGVDPSEAMTKAEHQLTDYARSIGFQL